ncbi:MAG: hypothetical protein KKA42_16545 [candidate division Zixibacteria bacterium]|nr:hypothetical protein [candidate division Zixibacteria bacterium]
MKTSHGIMMLTFVLLLIASQTSSVQGGREETPEALAEEYFAVLQTEGMSAVGRFMHPDALSDFKDMLVPVFRLQIETGQRQLLSLTFGDSVEVADLDAMDPTAFFNGFMNVITALPDGLQPSFDKLEVLGTIEEGQARHVLTRVSVGAGEMAITAFEVLSFIPYEDSWRLQLSGKMKGLAQQLQASMGK